MTPPSLAFVHSLPPPPNTAVSDIRGNTSDKEKLFAVKGFLEFAASEGSYCRNLAQRLKIVEVNIADVASECTCVIVHEIEVTRDMCNYWSVLHGACSSFIADSCCASSLYTLGARMGIDARGFTKSMEVVWFNPAPIGTSLQVVSTARIKDNMRSAGCEIKDKKTGKIYASSVLSLGPLSKSRKARM
ncbi:hypothetical protein DFH09DRAFT_1445518 [Mycena vulgaris]|nr:hypothetical protein DFH09DRAFT_1445518 [Mycena vulgaris]